MKKYYFALIITLQSCYSSSNCKIDKIENFEGEGILITRDDSSIDGLYPVIFVPVCNLDTNSISNNLKQEREAISFFASYKLIQNIIKKRSDTLIENNIYYGKNNIYLSPISLKIQSLDSTGRRKKTQYLQYIY